MADQNNTAITLAEVDEALRAVMEGGQKVVVGDREYEAADLDDLRKLRSEVAAAERSKAGQTFVRVTFGRVC